MKKTTHTAFLISLFLIGFVTYTFGQGYRIEATFKGVKDSSFVLGHYSYSNKQFVAKDTAKADANGHMVFEDKTNLPGGLYLLLFPGNQKWVEIVYSGKETKFSIETDTASLVESMQVKGSKENQLFYAYQKELKKGVQQIEALNQNKTADAPAKMKAAQDNFKTYRDKFFKENADSFTIKLFKMSSEPEVPAAPKLANGKTDSLWVFNYYKGHYWDEIDFSDDRILRTPFLEAKIDRYIKNLVVQTPDSLIKDTDWLVAKASANKDVKSYVVFYIINQYENPKTVGTEALWVHMANKYYLSGDMGISDDSKKRISEKVNTLRDVLVDKTFPALPVADAAGKKINLQAIDASYTVLFFYSATCGHCKEASPVLKSFYDKNKADGVKVIAINTEHNQEEWKTFVTTYHLEELINGIDPLNQVDFNKKFDVVTTPTIYVLDKNKKIIARKMPVEQLDDFLNYYKKKQLASTK